MNEDLKEYIADLGPTPAEQNLQLSEDELGHIRHVDNLSRKSNNDWSGMQQRALGQEDGATYRYQLAYGALGLALAHAHRLPAAPGLFEPIFRRLIEKMLLPEVWMYWRDVSRAGGMMNPHLKQESQFDPVARDNIMYSAYVHAMISLYGYLFADDRFAEEEAIVFQYNSPYWGGGTQRFAYDSDSLGETLYWQLVQNGYLGIACYPNCIFQVCIQPAILGFRMQDLRNGGSRAEEITRGYLKAWSDLGQLDENGHYVSFVQYDSKTAFPGDIVSDAWLGTLLNMWNPEMVRDHYPSHLKNSVYEASDGTTAVKAMQLPPEFEFMTLNQHGWVTALASEMGDTETLDGLLGYADLHLGRTWSDAGLYYRRNDQVVDAQGNPTLVDPFSGNVQYAYARLNIPGGLWRLYNQQWRDGHHEEPALLGVARDVDVSRASFDPSESTLHFTVRRRTDITTPSDDEQKPGTIRIGRLAAHGPWRLIADDGEERTGDDDELTVQCSERETTYQLLVGPAALGARNAAHRS